MRKSGLYSSARKAPPESVAVDTPVPSSKLRSRFKSLKNISLTDPRLLWLAIVLLALLLFANIVVTQQHKAPKLTQEIIDSAVLKTLETADLPSPAAKAYETILPAVVQVRSFVKSVEGGEDVQHGVGTGVVIVDKGIILTNLHVVQGAQIIKVTFADGLEATASITGTQPENDLAVLQAHKMPDDLIAATMRSTADLRPGDQVLAVGFPFGIGPSASAGVVSGLKRTFRSPEGDKDISNLIQFDAAANPGNSGGPLVTMDGQVVGIVTAILNPSKQRTFIGIGFAVPIENAAQAAGMPPF
jgi:S1-C subfamily serine protease